MYFKKIIAFTMAEVLIVLAIIGVTAAISLPALNTDIEERKVVSKLRKIYPELDGIYQTIAETYGHPHEWNVARNTNSATMTSTFGNYFAEFAAVKKDCGTGAGCFGTGHWLNNSSDYRKFLMKDGSSVAILIYEKEDTIINYGDICGHHQGYMYVDVNGPSGENMNGYDVFELELCSKKGVAFHYNNIHPGLSFGVYAADWVIKAGNRDYLKCADDLDWDTKRTCD